MKKSLLRLLTLSALAAVCWHPGARPSVEGDVKNAAGAVRTVAAFAGQNKLYVSNLVKVNESDNIARVSLARENGKTKLIQTALASSALVKNKDIPAIATTPDGYPVTVAVEGAAADANKVTVIIDPAAPFQSEVIKDAAGNAALNQTKSVAAIAASNTHVLFAGRKNNANNWGGDNNSGFGLAAIDRGQKKVYTFEGDAGVRKIDDSGKLIKINLTNTTPGDPTIVGPIGIANAVTINGGEKADITWDEKLGKFYVGIDTVKGGGQANGVVGVMVSSSDVATTDKVGLVSIIGTAANADPDTLTPVDHSGIFCNKEPSGGAENWDTCIRKIRTMHTSSGKDYLIVNGGAELDANVANASALSVFAVPLVGSGANKGYIAKKTDLTAKVAAAGDMTKTKISEAFDLSGGDKQAVVGGKIAYLAHTNTGDYATLKTKAWVGVQDMQIVGDTVFIALNGSNTAKGDNNQGEEKGIFSSTAIFDDAGAIRAWTPWQRALPSQEGVKNFGYDASTGNFTYLKANGANAIVTQWSKGDAGTAAGGYNIHGGPNKMLAKVIEDNFPNAGAVKLFSFDPETPGFRSGDAAGIVNAIPTKAYDQFSMMVATGNGRVALIETGKAGATTNPFAITTDYSVADVSKTFNADADLAKLGPIVTAEVSRIADAATGLPIAYKGWLFVGGKGGIAVMRDSNGDLGKGWATDDNTAGDQGGLAVLTDIAVTTAFKQLTSAAVADNFADTRKLVSDGTYLYILTKTKLYRHKIDQTKYNAGALGVFVPADFVLLADLTAAAGDPLMKNLDGVAIFDASVDEFYDMMLVQDKGGGNNTKLLLATSRGLYYNETVGIADAGTNVAALRWSKPYDKTGTANKFESGAVLKLDFVSSVRGGKLVTSLTEHYAEGNLYVTAVDKNDENVCVYRFNVSGGTVKAIKEQYTESKTEAVDLGTVFPERRNNTDYFYKIGSVKDLAGDISVSDVFDMQPQSAEYGNHGVAGDFLGGVAMTPNPSLFLNAGKKNSAIDLGVDLSNGFQLANVVKDTASGALYIPGQFGVRVNE